MRLQRAGVEHGGLNISMNAVHPSQACWWSLCKTHTHTLTHTFVGVPYDCKYSFALAKMTWPLTLIQPGSSRMQRGQPARKGKPGKRVKHTHTSSLSLIIWDLNHKLHLENIQSKMVLPVTLRQFVMNPHFYWKHELLHSVTWLPQPPPLSLLIYKNACNGWFHLSDRLWLKTKQPASLLFQGAFWNHYPAFLLSAVSQATGRVSGSKITVTWLTYVDNIHHCYLIICTYTDNLHRAYPHYCLKHTAAVLMNYTAPPSVIWTQLKEYCRAWAGRDRHQVRVRPPPSFLHSVWIGR